MYSISIFYFTFYLFGGEYAPNAPPAYEPVYSMHAGENTAAHRVYMYFRLEAKYGKKD